VAAGENEPFRQRTVREQRIRRRRFDMHRAPVRVEFFRRHLRQCGVDAGAHVAVRHDDRDAVVGRNLDPVGNKAFARLGRELVCALEPMAGPQCIADDECAGRAESAQNDHSA